MSEASRLLPALLAPALKAARAALRRLEPDEIPASLRRVAAYTGGRLPPPLASSLLDELDGNEWLRAKALEELADDEALGRLYLERPAGWARELAVASAALAADGATEELASARRLVKDAEERLAEARRRLHEVRSSESSAAADGEARELRRKLKAAHRRAEAEAERREAEVQEAAGRAMAADEAAAALAAEVHRLRSRLRRTRRDRARLVAVAQTAAAGGALRPRRPVEVARDLDDAARLLRAAPSPAGAAEAPAAAGPLELPAGVRPDDAAAIDWLVAQAEPLLLLVDGYNVTFSLSERGFATPEARSRLNAELGRLARLATALRVVVVYDSDQDHDAAVAVGPGGVEVVFAPADLLADEELVSRAEAAQLPAVVVSTDREVREGAEDAGALALWGEALVSWMRRRT